MSLRTFHYNFLKKVLFVVLEVFQITDTLLKSVKMYIKKLISFIGNKNTVPPYFLEV